MCFYTHTEHTHTHTHIYTYIHTYIYTVNDECAPEEGACPRVENPDDVEKRNTRIYIYINKYLFKYIHRYLCNRQQ